MAGNTGTHHPYCGPLSVLSKAVAEWFKKFCIFAPIEHPQGTPPKRQERGQNGKKFHLCSTKIANSVHKSLYYNRLQRCISGPAGTTKIPTQALRRDFCIVSGKREWVSIRRSTSSSHALSSSVKSSGLNRHRCG